MKLFVRMHAFSSEAEHIPWYSHSRSKVARRGVRRSYRNTCGANLGVLWASVLNQIVSRLACTEDTNAHCLFTSERDENLPMFFNKWPDQRKIPQHFRNLAPFGRGHGGRSLTPGDKIERFEYFYNTYGGGMDRCATRSSTRE